MLSELCRPLAGLHAALALPVPPAAAAAAAVELAESRSRAEKRAARIHQLESMLASKGAQYEPAKASKAQRMRARARMGMHGARPSAVCYCCNCGLNAQCRPVSCTSKGPNYEDEVTGRMLLN